MLNRAAVPLLGLLIVVLTGCASSESAMIATLPTVDVSGTWTGGTSRGAIQQRRPELSRAAQILRAMAWSLVA